MNADNQQERITITKELKWFLAGFIEGKGSVCASIKIHPAAKHGVSVDPGFFLYQRESGIKLLKLAQQVFGTGSIFPKPDDENVFVYAITSRRSLYEKVLPFFDKYMRFSEKWELFQRFKKTVVAIEEQKLHQTRDGMIRLVNLVYKMNPNSESEECKHTEQEVIDIILRGHMPESIVK